MKLAGTEIQRVTVLRIRPAPPASSRRIHSGKNAASYSVLPVFATKHPRPWPFNNGRTNEEAVRN